VSAIQFLIGLLAVVSVVASLAFAALWSGLNRPAPLPIPSAAQARPPQAQAPAAAQQAAAAQPQQSRAPAAATGAPPDRETIVGRVEALQKRLEEQPDDFDGWVMLGRSFVSLGLFLDAAGAYSQAAELRPSDPGVRVALQQLEEVARQSGVHEKTRSEQAPAGTAPGTAAPLPAAPPANR